MKDLWLKIASFEENIEGKLNNMSTLKMWLTVSVAAIIILWVSVSFLRFLGVAYGYPPPSYIPFLDFWWAWIKFL